MSIVRSISGSGLQRIAVQWLNYNESMKTTAQDNILLVCRDDNGSAGQVGQQI